MEEFNSPAENIEGQGVNENAQSTLTEAPKERDFFSEESYYEKNPVVKSMQRSPYEPPQPPKYADPPYTPPDIKPANKSAGGAWVALVILVGILTAIAMSFSVIDTTDPLDVIWEPDENEQTEPERVDKTQTVPGNIVTEQTEPEPPLTAPDKAVSTEQKPKTDGEELSPEEVYNKIVPSVVCIRASVESTYGTSMVAGSGIIITDDGYIVTNEHVILGTSDIVVTTSDGKEYEGKIVGQDSKTDLAVIKIKVSEKLIPAELGDSDALQIGEDVFAIGNSGGLFSNTFTGGFVSGLNRTLRLKDDSVEMNYIQTDATINPGNSGGPLVNAYAQVIGINNFKYSPPTADYENITFAISINEAIPIINDLMSQGYVSGRVRIGITYTAISEQDAKEKGLVAGLYIAEVASDCDISHCDLKEGDIITKLNGRSVYNSATVQDAMKNCHVGDEITAEVYRKDDSGNVKTFTIRFKLEEFND